MCENILFSLGESEYGGRKVMFGTHKKGSMGEKEVSPTPLLQLFGLRSRPCTFNKGCPVFHFRHADWLEAAVTFALGPSIDVTKISDNKNLTV